MKRFLRDNGLSLVLFAVFALTLIGHAVSGWHHHNHQQADHGQPVIAFSAYLVSADFMESVTENWESEFLQMAAFVALTVFLFQKGSPESKDPQDHEAVDDDPRETRPLPADAPKWVRLGGWRLRIYENSLTLALTALFVISFWLHAWASVRLYNEERQQHGDQPITLCQHLGRSQLWYESFQNWQSEFLSMAVLMVFTVFLRQRGSSQSKPVATPHHQRK